MSGPLNDLRYSVRSLWRTPGTTFVLLLTIAAGVGSTASIYGFIGGFEAVHPGIAPSDGLVSIFGPHDQTHDPASAAGALTWRQYQTLKSHHELFDWTGAVCISRRTVVVRDHSIIATVATVTPEIERLTGLAATPGQAIVSYRFSQFELNDKVANILLGGRMLPVSAVAPEALEGIYDENPIDIWLSEDLSRNVPDAGIRNVWPLAHLRGGVFLSRVSGALPGVLVRGFSGRTPEQESARSNYTRMLRATAGFVLFIVCANVASLLLGRAHGRDYETALRVAIGASRAQLARAILADSAVLTVAGSAIGGLFALWTSRIVPILLFEQDAAALSIVPNLISTIVVPMMAAALILACGMLPLVENPHARPAAVLRREGAGRSRETRLVRSALAVAQMGCCCVLVISIGVLLADFRASLRTTAGELVGDTVLATVEADENAGMEYFRNVERAAKQVEGVAGVSWSGRLPGSRSAWMTVRIDPQPSSFTDLTIDVRRFTPQLLDLIRWPPRNGRFFGAPDAACEVAVASERAAEVLFPEGGAVGRSVVSASGRPVTILGVVALRKAEGVPLLLVNSGSLTDGLSRFRIPTPAQLASAELNANVVSPEFFGSLGFTLVAGRLFEPHEGVHECRVGIVNQEAADLYFQGNAIGAAVIDEAGRRTPIIGLVRSPRLGAFQRREQPSIYFPMTQDWLRRMTLVVKVRISPQTMLEGLKRAIEAVPGRGKNPAVVKTIETHLGETALAPLRIATVIIGASSAIGLLLSILGLYGVLNDAARQQRTEFALRIALGATLWNVIAHVLMEGVRMAAAGSLLGLAVSALLLRYLPGFALAGGAHVWVWIAGPLVLFVTAVLSSLLPARRALLIEPTSVLREVR